MIDSKVDDDEQRKIGFPKIDHELRTRNARAVDVARERRRVGHDKLWATSSTAACSRSTRPSRRLLPLFFIWE